MLGRVSVDPFLVREISSTNAFPVEKKEKGTFVRARVRSSHVVLINFVS